MSRGLLTVISAPSGGGKTTLVHEILKQIPEMHYSVSCTTRAPRAGEVNGRDYFFIGEKEFAKKKEAGEFIEWAFVHGYWYGTPRDTIEKSLNEGSDILLDIDVQGAQQIKKIFPECVLVFVAPPSLSVLEDRLRARKQDDEATIARRLANAKSELERAKEYDYLILNDQIAQAIEQLRCILMAEKLRSHRHPLPYTKLSRV